MNKIKFIIFAATLAGCSKYTTDEAIKQLNKANDLQPKTTANFVKERFPCNPRTDTIINTQTDYKYMEVICPPKDSIVEDTIYLDKIVNKTNYKTITKVVGVPTKTITVTKYITDSAKLKSINIEYTQTIAELKNCAGKNEKKSEWIKWLIICLGISIILNILQLRK
jgi:hypothetical protein